MRIAQLFKLLFAPDRFIDEGVQEAAITDSEGQAKFRTNEEGRTKRLRRAIYTSLLLVVATSAVAAGVSCAGVHCFPDCMAGAHPVFQVLSAILIVWAVLGKLGWSIQTIKGSTLPERINEYWFRLMTVLGLFFLMTSIFTQVLLARLSCPDTSL